MGVALEGLQRIGLKLFAADGSTVRPRELVPIFHRWIQSQAIAGHLLIDVADYSHVPDGPGVLLVAHEGNFSMDLGEGRMGLAFNRKAAAPGSLNDRLVAITRTTLEACQRLEDDAALQGRLRFRGDEVELFANDRLIAPNTSETQAAFQAPLTTLQRTLYGDAACTVTPNSDRRERFGMHLKSSGPASARDLLARLR